MNDPKSLSFFAFHAPLQGLALSLFTWGKLSLTNSVKHSVILRSGIMTLQPTSQPSSKVAGLFRHQVWILYAAFPSMILGSLSVIYNKNINGRPHFVSWHGVSFSDFYLLSENFNRFRIISVDFWNYYYYMDCTANFDRRWKCLVWREILWGWHESEECLEIS